MEIEVRNTSSRPVPYLYGDYDHDFAVEGPTGLVWFWSAGRPFEHWGPGEEVLEPDEVMHWKDVWRQKNCMRETELFSPGTYSARGVFVLVEDPYEPLDGHGDWGWWSEPVEFEIR